MKLLNILFLLYTTIFVEGVVNEEENMINTEKCKIPNIDPFGQGVKKMLKTWNYVSCNTSELLTYTTTRNNVVTLHVKEYLAYNWTSGNFRCCYSNVTRNGTEEFPDIGISISECKEIDREVVLGDSPVMVKCMWNEIIVYENVHQPIVIRDSIKRKLKRTDSESLSVLFIVVDSLSRLNFMRTMPRTRRFLLESDFIEMKGYNKVGMNTFPNFMALLTGYNPRQSYQLCNPYELKSLDECPMIWYKFRDLGYVTAYGEDFDTLNTFNYLDMRGFTNPPTDYYFKSYMTAAETLNISRIFRMPYCTGPETSGERILNLARDFTGTFKGSPYFGIFWMNTFSHNELNSPSIMDGKLEQFFEDIKRSKVLDESVVIFFSDHGVRFGNIVSTFSGWYEDRLPVNYISLPRKFREKFTDEYNNVKRNSEKLTNTYDMYMTLQHILALSNPSYQINSSLACSQCLSLLQNIPDRSCQDASISTEFCACK